MRVLIVEDDSSTRQLLARIIENRGHLAVQAKSAEEAKDLYTTEFFPLIILDLNLPGIDGLEFSRWVREQPTGDYTYILVGTVDGQADRQTHTLNQILEAGSDDYIAKPYQADFLHVRLTIAESQVHELELRKKLEIALKQERDFISAVFDTAPFLIIVMNLNQEVIHLNETALLLTEMDLDSQPQFPGTFIAPEEAARVDALLQELKKSAQPVAFEAALSNSEGKKRRLSWRATLISPEEVALARIVCTGIEVTESDKAPG